MNVLLCAGILGVATASAATIHDVTLTSWQLNLSTAQETFTLSGSGVSLMGSGYASGTNGGPLPYPASIAQSFDASRLNGGTFATGTIDGVTYDASNPLGLYGAGPYFTLDTVPPPSGADPVVTVPVDVISRPPNATTELLACSPDCLSSSNPIVAFFNFLSSSGDAALQYSGPDPSNGSYTLESFDLTSSTPTPEPASYFFVAFGLVGGLLVRIKLGFASKNRSCPSPQIE